MKTTTHPSKEKVRDFMEKRREEDKPPPTPEEVRRELGWELLDAEREAKQPR